MQKLLAFRVSVGNAIAWSQALGGDAQAQAQALHALKRFQAGIFAT